MSGGLKRKNSSVTEGVNEATDVAANNNNIQEKSAEKQSSPNKRIKEDSNVSMVEKERKFNSFTAQLALRIKDYLEYNKNKRFIDPEDLYRTLYDQYPEYGRKKFKAFKVSAEKTFQNLQEELMNNRKNNYIPENKTPPPPANIEPDPTVVKKSINSIMLDLYAKSPKPTAATPPISSTPVLEINVDDSNETKSAKKKKKKSMKIDVIEDDDTIEDINEPPAPREKNIAELVADNVNTIELTEFEKIKLKAQKFQVALKNKDSSEKKAKKRPRSSQDSVKESEPQKSQQIVKKRVSVDMDKDTSPVVNITANDDIFDISIDNTALTNKVNGVLNSKNGPEKNTESNPGNKNQKEPIEIMDIDDEVQTIGKNNLKKTAKTPIRKGSSAEKRNKSEDNEDFSSGKKSRQKYNQKGVDDEIEEAILAKHKQKGFEITESKYRFSDFGGNEELLCDICKLMAHLKHPELYKELGVAPPRGFLLHGPPGCGKTLLAHAIAGELELPFIKVAAPELVSGVSGNSESKIRDLFTQAIQYAPCVLFIDEIDCITPKRENAQREMERRIVAQLLTSLDELGESDTQVVVIGATNRPDSLDPALRRAGRFDREIGLGIPDRAARQKILDVLCRELRLAEDVSLQNIAILTPGYVGADLSSLVRESAIAAINRVFKNIQGNQQQNLSDLLEWLKDTSPLPDDELQNLFIEQSDWQAALKVVQPSAKREGFATVPGVSWADVGALTNIREELQLSILAPVRFQEEFECLGLPASSGVLLAGPPGCGKTLVAKAIANEAGINFISVKGPELLNMYVGESERAVRACFARARNSAPCVIFFDEIDSLCPRRSGNSSDGGSSSRVVNQLLTEMDGVQIRNGVFLMAATNRPDILDPAVLRPGRLDKILYVGFPEPQDRCEILKALTKNGSKPNIGTNVNLDTLGLDSRCTGYTGADMSALVREASMAALKDRLKMNIKDAPRISVNQEHFELAFSKVRPSVDAKDQHHYRNMKKKYAAGSSAVVDPNKVAAATEKAANKTTSFLEQTKTATFVEQQHIAPKVTDTLVTKALALAAEHIADAIDSDQAGVIFTEDMEITTGTHTNDQTSQENIDNDESPTNITDVGQEIDFVTESLEDNTNTISATVSEEENMICDNKISDTTELSKSGNELSKTKNDNLNKVSENGDSNKADDINKKDVENDAVIVQQDKTISGDLSDIDESPTKDIDTAKEDKDTAREDIDDCLVEKEVAKVDSITKVKFLPEKITSYEDSVTDKESSEPRKENSVENKLLNFLNNSEDVDNESQDDNLELPSDDDKSKDSETCAAPVKAKRTSSLDSDKSLSAVESSQLRFLPDMIIRVVDSSKVPSAAGRTGTVRNIRKNAKVTVLLEGLSQRIVNASELEPFMPEEGDKVKFLIPNSTKETGKVLSMNDEDICKVKMDSDGTIQNIVIDNLCKIDPNPPKL